MKGHGSGFTLVETLVALIVLSVALTMILQLFSGGINSKRRSGEYTRAVFRASEVMETILVSDTLSDQVLEGSFEDGFTWKITLLEIVDDQEESEESTDEEKGVILYQVDLDLSWESGERTKHFQVSTLKMVQDNT